ncbi:mitochondrial ATP synthase subunit [Trifolium pratense]|uniref:Mitochondrial ATP synthase subunit n=2 Tax=Trifolium pratense TaxID=57577 RepID=A0A2K3NL61_TRIPR|nr:mitochondrial ATP synthase subunit [Trifolium pratense]
MRKFDPWPVFFKREWKRNWPFLVGFAVTGTLITKFSLGLTEEDAKNSNFVKAHNRLLDVCRNSACSMYVLSDILEMWGT